MRAAPEQQTEKKQEKELTSEVHSTDTAPQDMREDTANIETNTKTTQAPDKEKHKEETTIPA